MKQTWSRIPRKGMILGALLAVFVLTLGVGALRARSSAARDRENLRQQRIGMGIPDPRERRARFLDEMAGELGLTEAQKGQLKALMEQEPDRRSIFRDRSLSREQRRARMRERREERNARIRSILTPEQQVRFEQMQEERRQRFRGTRGPGRGFGGPAGPGPGGSGWSGPAPGVFPPPQGGTPGDRSGSF